MVLIEMGDCLPGGSSGLLIEANRDATLDTGIWAAVQGDGPVETTREASHE